MAFAPHNISNPSAPYLTDAAEGYTRWATSYDHSPNPILAREERYLLPLLGDVRRKRILDLACGTGRWLEKLAAQAAHNYTGIDSSAAMLAVASEKHNIAGKVTRGRCEGLPFRDHAFDLAICSFAVGHIADLDEFSAEAARVIKPGADLFITDLHPAAYDHGWRVGFRDQTTAVEINALVRSTEEIILPFHASGFQCIRQESLWLETPEQVLFARAGKKDQFASASQVPAIIAFHLRRSYEAADIWET